MNTNANEYPALNGNGNGHGPVTLNQVYERLGKVIRQLEDEIALQQKVIEKQIRDIGDLKAEMEKKEKTADNAAKQMQESLQHVEANRQLINKLLSDIDHYQNDIDWYKRTYEKRSIWGVIKDKLTRDPHSK